MNEPQITSEQLIAHQDRLRALVSRLLLDEDSVEDVVQEVWLAALKARPGGLRNRGAWLARVARNLALRLRRENTRRARRERRASRPEAVLPVASEEERQQTLIAVTQAVTALPQPHRMVVALRFFEGLTLAEIAAQLDAPRSTVKFRLQAAMVQLRTRLKQVLGDQRASWCLALLSLFPAEEWAGVAGQTSAVASAAKGAALLGTKAKIAVAAVVCCGVLTTVFWPREDAEPPPVTVEPRTETRSGTDRPVSTRAAVTPATTGNSRPVAAARPAPIPPAVLRDRYIHGVVTRTDGSPVVGARVQAARATKEPCRGPGGNVFSTRSNERGEYFLGPLEGGTLGREYGWWVVEASSPDAGKRRKPAWQGAKLDFRLDLPACLSGRITHAGDGRPAAGAEVVVFSRTFIDACEAILYFKELRRLSGRVGPDWKEVTDQGGSFHFRDLPPGSFSLAVYPTDRKLFRTGFDIELRPGQETRRSLVLPEYRTFTVTGRVLDRETGVPVKGFTLCNEENPNLKAVSDEEGRYEIRGLGRGPNTIAGVGPDHVGFRKRTTFDTRPVHVLDFRPGRWARICGRVLDADGAPIPGALVGCNQFAVEVETLMTSRTDENGVFDHLKGLIGKKVRLYAGAPGRALGVTGEMAIQAGEEKAGIEIRLTRGGTVEGRVEDRTGRPVLDGAVALHDMKARGRPVIQPWVYLDPSAGGRFRIHRVPAGTYVVLGKSAENIRPYTAIHVVEGGTTSVVLTPRRGETVAGRILDPAGQPLAGVRVRARFSGCGVIGPKIYSFPDGTFRFDGLQRGVYDFFLEHPGRFSRVLENVRTGSTDLQAILHPRSSLTGRVLVRETLLPVTVPFWLRFYRTSPGPLVQAIRDYRNTRGTIQEDGDHGLMAGTYDVEAGTDTGLISQPITDVVLGPGLTPDPLEFILESGGRIEGVVKDPEGHPLFDAAVDIVPMDGSPSAMRIRTGTDDRGRFASGALRPGAFRVEARHAQWASASREVRLLPGQTGEADLVLGRGVRMEIRVQDPEGRPVGDALIFVASGERDDSAWRGRSEWKTDGKGRLVLQELKPGLHRIRAVHPGWVSATRVVPVFCTDMVTCLRLGQGGTVAVQVRGQTSQGDRPIVNARVSFSDADGETALHQVLYFGLFVKAREQNPDLWWDDYLRSLERTDRTGALVRRFLPPGRYVVSVSAPGVKATKHTIQVENDRVTPLKVQLEVDDGSENQDG